MPDVLIVTGGSRGIGAATARLAAQRGWRVITSYLGRCGEAEAVVRDITEAGGEAMTVQADSSQEADVRRLFDAAEDRFGPVTGLVNNAGMNGGPARLTEVPAAELRQVLEVNVLGTLFCCQEAVRRMSTDRGGQGGAIVNLGSAAVKLGSPGERVHYAASKGAIVSLTIGLAREVIRNGVRVNCVSPGLTETEMNPQARLDRVAPLVPIGRAADPMEIARTILFLLSPEASYIVGATIVATGGR